MVTKGRLTLQSSIIGSSSPFKRLPTLGAAGPATLYMATISALRYPDFGSAPDDSLAQQTRSGMPIERTPSLTVVALPATETVILDPRQQPAAWETTFPSGSAGCMGKNWSGRRGSNPRPRPWQGRALPLSYTRILCRSHDAPATAVVCQKREGNATATGGIDSHLLAQCGPKCDQIDRKGSGTAESASVD